MDKGKKLTADIRDGKIKGAIFDLDGVLLDSMTIWTDLGERYLAMHGIEAEEGLAEILFSMSMEQGAEYLVTNYPLAETAAQAGDGIREMLRDFYYNEVGAKRGAEELLRGIAARGIRITAATSSPRGHVEAALERLNWKIDTVLTHTCPIKFTPTEAMFPGLDQSKIDKTTEQWLDTIEDRLDYNHWFCGHWHINKHAGKLHFLMEDYEIISE